MTSQQFPEPIYLHLKPVLILRIERGGGRLLSTISIEGLSLPSPSSKTTSLKILSQLCDCDGLRNTLTELTSRLSEIVAFSATTC